MTLQSIPVIVMATVSFYVGFYHLYVYLRRPKIKHDLAFAITCIAVGVYDILCAGLYNVMSPQEGVVWQRYQLVTLAVLVISFLWFVAAYTQRKSNIIIIGFSILFLGFSILGIFDQSGLCWTDIPLVKHFQLPFGLNVTYHEMAFGPAMEMEAYLLIISYFYMLWVSIRFFLKGDRRKAKPLIMAVILFLLGVAGDTAVALGFYKFIYTIEYSFIGMVILMAYSLSNELIETTIIREALKESERKHRELLQMIPQKIFYKDKQSVYIACNENYARDFNLLPEQITGKTDYDLLPSELADKYRSDDIKIMEAGNTETFEENYILSDGQRSIVQTVKAPIRNAEGIVVGLVGIFIDITNAKKLEERIKQSQKMEAIGTLAGGIAHDFNNILGGIIGFTELAQDQSVNKETVNKYMNSVLSLALRAKDLVKQILTFSRKSQEQQKPIQLPVIVDEAVKLLRSTIPTSIEIRQRIDKQPMVVNADPTQMHQIIMNLCTNAAFAMRESGGYLDISLVPETVTPESMRKYHDISPGPYAKLEITDTGIGIDPLIIDRIFEPFFTTKDKEQGTGMGLSVVHGIVKEHHGDIFVESRPNEGTTFSILLPLNTTESSGDVASPQHIPTGTEHILFIDDETTLMELGKSLLESLGYTVTSLESSVDALTQYRQSPDMFDLVITDQTMPHMTGYNLAKSILKITPEKPIILCTGYSDSITKEKVIKAGIAALVYKPISKKDFAVKIRNILDSKKP
ncbi:MAG: response regulator [Spirochaetales bacterium]|nr:response regulator [Spirochaetales bacterium]